MKLRIVNSADFEVVRSWENNPEYWSVGNSDGPFSDPEITQFIDQSTDLERFRQCRWMIDVEEYHEAVGCVDLFEYDPALKSAGIGVLIGNKSFRRRGLAYTSIQQLMEGEIRQRGLRLVWCLIHPHNQHSIALFESLGFKIAGERIFRGQKVNRYTWKC